MAGWEDEPLGAFGSGANVPTGEWFPVNTDTGQWGSAPPTLASDAGVNWAGIPDLIPTRTMAPSPMMGVPGGAPDQAPVSLGQVSGTMAPPMTTPGGMQRAQRLDAMGALSPARSKWGDVLTAIGGASGGGAGIQGAFESRDRRAQQELQNRLTLRRQELQEAQNERAEIRDDFNSLLKLSEIKSKKLRNLYTDRFIADMQARGKVLPPDFVEAFKSSGGEEAKAMVKFYEPLLTDLGLDPTAFAELVGQGGIKEVGEALTLAQKLKKDKTEQARLAALDKIGVGDTLGDASGVTAPAAPGTSLTGPAQAPRGYADDTTTQPIIGSEKLTPSFTAKAQEVSDRLGMKLPDLLRIISFETGGTFDPAVKNRAGSGATGLIQFMPETAKALGTTTEALAKMTPEQQLDYVEKYLTPHKGKLGNIKDAYLAVLKPSALGGKATDPLFTQAGDPTAYRQNAGLDKSGKGVVTVGDAVDAVMRTTGGGTAPATTTGQPTAPTGGTPQEQQALAKMDRDIDTMRANIPKFERIGGEEGNKRADNTRANLKILIDERKNLQERIEKAQERGEEGSRALEKQRLLEPGRLREQEAGRALTPISDVTQKSLATNKSIYRSIGKMEEYLREGTDLPADFVNLVAQDAPGISAWLQSDPKNITGLAKQWETKFKAVAENDPRANRFLSALGNMRDLVIRERSGGSVTGNELDRAMGAFMGSLPNINQAFSLFAQNLANVKETVMDELVTSGAAARPLSGGKAMYGTLPKEIRDRIDYAERGEDYPKAQMPEKPQKPVPPKGQVGGPITVVSP